MSGRSVVVTGASPNSIGYFVAATLAAWGADAVVTATGRCEAMADALRAEVGSADGGGNIAAHPLDLSDTTSVAAFAEWYLGRSDELHVLVNNAGVLLDVFSEWDTPRRGPDGIEVHWRTNYLGTFHLTRLLLPVLVRAGLRHNEARLVNVSSSQHARARNEWLFSDPASYSSWVAYGQSKLALVHHSFELQRRYGRDFNIRSMALHPGSGYTNMIRRGIVRSRSLGRFRRIVAPLASTVLLTAEQCAQTIIHCASHPDAEGGRYYRRCVPSDASTETQDEEVSRRLWKETERRVKNWEPGKSQALGAKLFR